jgi:hypothetical protein
MAQASAAIDSAALGCRYAILRSPFPVQHGLSTPHVRKAHGGTGSPVEWSGELTPNGVSDRKSPQLFRQIVVDDLEALDARIAPRKQ